MKVKRHNKILEIIDKYNVETQEELIEKLRLAGFNVTQAGSYKYTRPDSDSHGGQALFSRTFSGAVKSVNTSLNDVVIKTYPGMANAVAAFIDSLHDDDILGCVAGDDCIIIVARGVESASAISGKIKDIISY